MTDSSPNRAIWDQAFTTDPKYTKTFNRGGGFKGTAINATYLARKATDIFGPCGIGWGIRIEDESMLQGAPILNSEGSILCHEIIHRLRITLWYKHGEETGEITHFGQTQFVGRNKNGVFTDEEAPKKSLTDAMTKCLSMLGFAGDVHLGLFDDNKYVAEVQAQFSPKLSKEQVKVLADLIDKIGADPVKVAEYYGAPSLAELPESSFARAKAQLESRVAKEHAAEAAPDPTDPAAEDEG